MSTLRQEAGLVSNNDDTVHFYKYVFLLEQLGVLEFPVGKVYKLGRAGESILKVMVPTDEAKVMPVPPRFHDVAGLRYLTFWVDDLDAAVGRCPKAGGAVLNAPAEIRPGVRFAILRDVDGNMVEVMEETA